MLRLRSHAVIVATLLALAGLAAPLSLRAQPAPAKLRLARLFADGAVLQRGTPIPVWGWAPPNAAVAVSFRGQVRRTVADADGTWRVRLSAAPAGGPHTLVVAAGRDTIRL